MSVRGEESSAGDLATGSILPAVLPNKTAREHAFENASTREPPVGRLDRGRCQRPAPRVCLVRSTDRARLESSAGVAAFVASENSKAVWVEAGRCYERFALQADLFGIRTAFINQPVEVTDLRPGSSRWSRRKEWRNC
jgi:hypothetical protein